ncbi:MAG: protein translocase subunit SecF, partial [bacterium]|nr:protein translocase subunit SecF [bacterium]
MKIFTKNPNFNFMSKRMLAFGISGVVILLGIVLFITKDFNLGIDFTGGTMIEVSFKDEVSIDVLRKNLKDVGLSKSMIQRIQNENKFFIKTTKSMEVPAEAAEAKDDRVGFTALIKDALMSEEERKLSAEKLDLNDSSEKRITDFLTRNGMDLDAAKESSAKLVELSTESSSGLITDFSQVEALGLKKRVMSLLKEKAFLGSFTFLSTETVGPQVGHDMQGKATRAAIYAMLGMLIYIGFRFRFIFGLAAVITLLHDVLITLAILLLLNIEITLPVVAAILTIVGYSLNDTIVIFDRVRENLDLMKKETAEVILNRSINQTLSRTIVTSGTTLCTVLSLFFFGGEVIHAFSFTLILGVLIGTYSSIFQSCAWLKIWEKKFLIRKK